MRKQNAIKYISVYSNTLDIIMAFRKIYNRIYGEYQCLISTRNTNFSDRNLFPTIKCRQQKCQLPRIMKFYR